jgi:hypothetical protein
MVRPLLPGLPTRVVRVRTATGQTPKNVNALTSANTASEMGSTGTEWSKYHHTEPARRKQWSKYHHTAAIPQNPPEITGNQRAYAPASRLWSQNPRLKVQTQAQTRRRAGGIGGGAAIAIDNTVSLSCDKGSGDRQTSTAPGRSVSARAFGQGRRHSTCGGGL